MKLSSVSKLLSGKIKLPSPPAIAIKILETVRKDKFTFQDLARVIESDPALTARVLRSSNSSHYKMSGTVNSIEKSLSILGTHAVRNIALSFVICSEFQYESYGLFDTTYFWRRALSSAVAADLTAKLTGNVIEDIFIIAMLQDIGILVMHNHRHKEYQSVFELRKLHDLPLLDAERKIFGYDHQEVGGELLKKWLLPEEIYGPIYHHHELDSTSDKYQLHTNILTISNDLSSFFNSSNDAFKIRHVKQIFDTEFGIQGSVIEEFIESFAPITLKALSLFDIAPNGLKPFSQILQEANDGLSQLYDSYELQIIELKQAKQTLERQASELIAAIDKLQELASRDGLTGLLNYRSFQEALDREIVRSKRYGREFSLLFFDIDYFKKINDKYGHPVGDLVLIEICSATSTTIRSTDILVRCGGDEFAIILVETNRKDAIAMADHLRECINNLTIPVEDELIKVKISIGLTSFDPLKMDIDKHHITIMADKALIKAKNSGKNQTFVI